MRRLIIGTPRCGAHALGLKLSRENRCSLYANPFDNLSMNASVPDEEDNLVTKTNINHPTDSFFNATYPIVLTLRVNYYSSICEKYDEVILIDRKDTLAQVESYAHNIEFLDKFSPDDYNPTPYSFIRSRIKDDVFESAKRQISESKLAIKRLSYKLNIPIVWYEEVFNVESNERYRKLNLL